MMRQKMLLMCLRIGLIDDRLRSFGGYDPMTVQQHRGNVHEVRNITHFSLLELSQETFTSTDTE